MAQAGYTPIQLYFSTTAAAVPTSGNLANGELGINIQDEKLYFKNAAGTVKLLASNATSAPVLTFSAGTTGFTPNTATSGAITLAGTLGTANGGTNLTSFTANGVVYASSSSALATGSALTFDGTSLDLGTVGAKVNFATTGSATRNYIGLSADGYSLEMVTQRGAIQPLSYKQDFGVGHVWSVTGSTALTLNSTSLYTASGINVAVGTSTATNARLYVEGVSASSTPTFATFTGGFSAAVTSFSALAGLQLFSYQSVSGGPFTKTSAIIANGDGTVPSELQFWTKTDGQSSPALRATIDSVGNVSIGASPNAYKLNVRTAPATSGLDGAYISDGTRLIIVGQSGATYNYAAISANENVIYASANPLNIVADGQTIKFSTGNERMRITTAGNVGIGTSSPTSLLELNKTLTNDYSAIRFTNSGASGRSYEIGLGGSAVGATYANNLYFFDATAGSNRMTLDSAGNVGIGITPPAWVGYTALQVKGGSFASSSTEVEISANCYYNSGWKYLNTDSIPAVRYEQYSGQHSWFSDQTGAHTAGDAVPFTQTMTLTPQGYLGLGTTSPSTYGAFAVRKAVTTADTTNCSASFSDAANSTFDIGHETNIVRLNAQGSALAFNAGSAERARFNSTGSFLIGTTSTAQNASDGTKILAGGNVSVVNNGGNDGFDYYNSSVGAYRFYVQASGQIAATITTIAGISDQRLKENIRDLDEGLDVVMALKPRKFDWKEGKGQDIKNARGFIAQEFETVLPDMIEEWRDPAPEGEEAYKAINANLIPTLVKAMQEQQAIIESLKARLDAANL